MNSKTKLFLTGRMPKWVTLGLGTILGGCLLSGNIFAVARAQVITSSGLNTQINAPVALPGGAVQYNITGGTRPGGGANLFHSFGEFGVPTNNIANFLNDAALPTTNILSRVTGGNPSNILGTIQTEGFGNANLFLMNPAGVVFGPDASLNVGGATHFTTADYLRLADGVQFTALPGAQDALLSIAPVAAFGFLGPNPGAISVEGSMLSVGEGQTLSLVGGDVTIGSNLNAPEGKIAIASVASPGEVLADTYASAPNINGQSFTTMGNISLLEGTTLDVSGDAAGTVIIRGGQLMMTNAVVSADTVDGDGAPVAIDINVTGDLSISTVDGPALTARTSGTGNAGEVKLSSGGAMDISGTGFFEFLVPMIDTHTSGPGNAGNVTLTSEGDMTVTGDLTFFAITFLADTGTDGFDTGKGGDLSITAQNFTGVNSFISTGNFFSFFNGGEGAGPAGNVTISTAEKIDLFFSDIITDSFDFFFDTGGDSGDVTLTARDINFDRSNISTTGWFRAGNLTIHTDTLTLSESQFQTITRTEPGGAVTITGRTIELLGSEIVSTTKENANAGDITISATEHLSLLNRDAPFSDGDKPSSIASNSFTDDGSGILGAPGSIRIATPNLMLDGGSKINSSSGSSGNGGPVIINAKRISMSGQTGNVDLDDLRNFGQFQASGIFTGSLGGSCAGPCGNAGSVNITTDSLLMGGGAQINSSTITDGKGGSINVNTSGNISISGILEDGTPGGVLSQTTGTEPGSGAGGTISLTSGQNFTLSDGATVSASSTGTGNSGSISITANSGDVHVNQGSVTTAATQAEAGNITISAAQSVNLSNLGGLLSLTLGDGKAGDIAIHSENLLLDGGRIFANSGGPNSTGQFVVGTGDAGNIAVEARNMVSLSNNGVVSSSTVGNGRGGDIALSAKQVEVSTGSVILTDTGSFDVTGAVSGQGQGGRVTVTAQDSVDLNGGQILTRTLGAGDAGDIVVETTHLNIANGGGLFATSGIPDGNGNLVTGMGSAGDITVTAIESLSLSGTDSFISSATGGAGHGGTIALQTGRLMVDDNAGIIATSGLFDRSGNFIVGQGNAGSITIEAAESASVSNGGLVSSSTGGGIGGVVSLSTPELVLTGGSIQARTVGDAEGGSISIQTGQFTMSHGAEMNTGSGLQNNQTGVLLAGKGNGGNISVSASQSITLSTEAQISTESLGEGKAGVVNLTTEGNFQGDDSTVSTSAQQGTGGDIIITAGKDVHLRNNTTVSAESFGTGNAGNISITAADTILIDKGTVTTEATSALGGNIKLTADSEIQLRDSQVLSRVQEGSGSAGSINFDPDFIVLKNSEVLSTAVFGDGGPITLTANSAILVDQFSILDARSQFGGSGTIDIQAPTKFLSGTIVPLPQDPAPLTNLYGTRCVAGAGGHFSTFVDSKADSLAPTPGTFLASPFLPLSNASNAVALNYADKHGVSETRQAVSLQVAAYSPPVLFGQSDGMLSACP